MKKRLLFSVKVLEKRIITSLKDIIDVLEELSKDISQLKKQNRNLKSALKRLIQDRLRSPGDLVRTRKLIGDFLAIHKLTLEEVMEEAEKS